MTVHVPKWAFAVLGVALVAAAAFLIGRGSGDDTETTMAETTTVTEETPTPEGNEPEEEDETTNSGDPAEEFTGRCTAAQPPLVPEPGKPGFTDVRVIEAPCDYGVDVATAFVESYGPACFEGCRKLVEGIPCETVAPIHADVLCSAARTEVRFSIEGSD